MLSLLGSLKNVNCVAGFLKSRRDRRKEKDKKGPSSSSSTAAAASLSKKKRDSDASSIKSDGEPSVSSERDKDRDKDEGLHSASETVESLKVDDEGYTIRPKDELWNTEKTSGFYSSSDGDSGSQFDCSIATFSINQVVSFAYQKHCYALQYCEA